MVSPTPPSKPNSEGVYQDGTDFSYFIQVGVGSTAKPMFMLFDTGAGTTWVMGSDCKSEACTMHNVFAPSDSKTYADAKQTFSIQYGSGVVSGGLAKDTVAVAGMSLSMTLGVASDTSGEFVHFPFDGILGVSMSRGATDNFLSVINASKQLKSNIFSVSLSRNSDGPNTGEVTFGGIDASKYTGDISYTPVSASAGGDWAITMDEMAYDGKKAGIEGSLAYIDTGTSYMFGPPEDVALLHKLIPGAKSDDGFMYKVPCDSTKALTVTFSGVAYTLSPKDWMSQPNGDTCFSNFYGQAVVQGAWLLGDSFLKNVYSVFDVDQTRIGFAAKPASSSPATTTGTPSVVSSSSSTNVSPSQSGTSSGSSPITDPSKVTSATGSSTTMSPFPGLSGHETPATQATPAAQTAGSSAATTTGTVSSPGEQLEGNRYASIICIVAVIAMVA